MYEVKTASRRVERQLDKVDDEIYSKVAEAIESLADNPRPFSVKKLAGRVHRIRVDPSASSTAFTTARRWWS